MANELITTNEIIEINDGIYKEHGRMRDTSIDGVTWLCAADVCEMLGYGNISDALNRHVKKADIVKREVRCYDQNRKMIFINNSGVYDLCNKSRLPRAKEIKEWIKSQFFASMESNLSVTAFAKQIINNGAFIDDLSDKVVVKIADKLETTFDAADKYHRFLDEKGFMDMRFAAQALNIPGVGRNKLFKILLKLNVLGKSCGDYFPMQEYFSRNWFKCVKSISRDGKHSSNKILVSRLGLDGLDDLLKKEGYII